MKKKNKVLIKIYCKAISKFEDTVEGTCSCLPMKESLLHPCICSNEIDITCWTLCLGVDFQRWTGQIQPLPSLSLQPNGKDPQCSGVADHDTTVWSLWLGKGGMFQKYTSSLGDQRGLSEKKFLMFIWMISAHPAGISPNVTSFHHYPQKTWRLTTHVY